MTPLEEIKSTAAGAQIIADWLGAGGQPVKANFAEIRAWICEYCPENTQPGWWDRVKDAVAEVIRSWLEVKNKIGLRVSNEDKLGMCRICGCCNRLAVHVPFEHIRTHLTQSQVSKSPNSCWKVIALKES